MSIFVFAGENSGDLYGGELIASLKREDPSLHFFGVPGPHMREQGVDPLLKMEEFQVIGFFDVLIELPSLMKRFYLLRREILKRNPKIAIFIDYPGFSLRLERSLRKKGFQGKIVHAIAPTVWAWGKKRIEILEKNTHLLLTLFPFEKQFFHASSLRVEYVGHPLEKKIAAPLQTASERPFIGIFPGSRKKEILRNLPFQIEAIRHLFARDPARFFFISIAHESWSSLIHSLTTDLKKELKDHLLFLPVHQVEGVLKTTLFAIAKSGTITLELALHEVPTIVIYAIKALDLFLAQKVLRIDLPHYCLVNILMKKRIFPELYGPNLTTENLCSCAEEFLLKKDLLLEKIKECQKLRDHLTKEHTPKPAAQAILSLY
jgi:lipid-A-disaccharide synthase